jgi:5-formyltetrahydrofolate cyclo-ligase
MLLDPTRLTVPFWRRAASRTALSAGQSVGVEQMRPVDLVICGSVAVNDSGCGSVRGRGLHRGGAADRGGPAREQTTITTVHDLQIVDEELAEVAYDVSIDLIVTPTQVISVRVGKKVRRGWIGACSGRSRWQRCRC